MTNSFILFCVASGLDNVHLSFCDVALMYKYMNMLLF